MAKKVLTLCHIHQPPRLLLGYKKRGFGVGRWNGFGGKVKAGETIIEAAKREVKEEAGLIVEDLRPMGVINFEFVDNGEHHEVHIFKVTKFISEPIETEEMKPQWFLTDQIPFEQMWPGDKYWLPLLIADKRFEGKVVFGGSDKLLDYQVREVSDFNE